MQKHFIDSTTEPVLIADSFRVKMISGSPHVVDFAGHLQRFTKSVLRFSKHDLAPALSNFLTHATAQLKLLEEDAFPRLEAKIWRDKVNFSLQMRPLPTLQKFHELVAVNLATHKYGFLKGPNIEYFLKLRESSGGEALLVDKSNNVLETTTSSLLWLQDNAIFSVADRNNRVESITENAVLTIARELNIEVKQASITIEQLTNFPVLSVNALHGIREVPKIQDVTLPKVTNTDFFKELFQNYHLAFAPL